MEFEWDDLKNTHNHRKHGIRFEDASRVFDDPNVVLFIERHHEGEERWHAIGMDPGTSLILVVVHTYRTEPGVEVVRIISARRALAWRGDFMTRRTRDEIGPLTPERAEELNRLAARPDNEIDTSDIPPVTSVPSSAIRGNDWRHYRGKAIVLTPELHAYFSALADCKGVSISALVNDFLAREVAVVEAVK